MSTISLLPQVINLNMLKNCDAQLEFTLTDSAGGPDLSDDTVTFVAKDAYGGTVQIEKSNGPSGHSDPTAGKTAYTFSNSELVGNGVGNGEVWVYQIRRIVAGTGDEIVYIIGNLTLSPSF